MTTDTTEVLEVTEVTEVTETTETTPALVMVDANEYGLAATEALQVEAVFMPMIAKMAALEIEFNILKAKPITKDTCKEAGKLRNRYVKIRTGTSEIHKKAKKYYLAGGRFIDGWKNAQAFTSQGKEEALLEIENHFEKLEAERIAATDAERRTQLAPYTNAIPGGIAYLEEEEFNNYLLGAKLTHENKIREEQEAATLREQIAEQEAAAQLLVEQENEKLKAESAALKANADQLATRLGQLTRLGLNFDWQQTHIGLGFFIDSHDIITYDNEKWNKLTDAIQIKHDEKAAADKVKKEAEAAEAKVKKEADDAEAKRLADIAETARQNAEKEVKRLSDQLAANNAKEKKRLSDELAARNERERKEIAAEREKGKIEQERKAAALLAAKAPDKEKLTALIEALELTLPDDLTTGAAKLTGMDIALKFEGFKRWAQTQINSL